MTRSHDEPDEEAVERTLPPIEVVRDADSVRITGCKANDEIPWPPK